jgi:hypothetical protein
MPGPLAFAPLTDPSVYTKGTPLKRAAGRSSKPATDLIGMLSEVPGFVLS